MVEVHLINPLDLEMEVFNRMLRLFEGEFTNIMKLAVTRKGLYTYAKLIKNFEEHAYCPMLLRFHPKRVKLAVVNLKNLIDRFTHHKFLNNIIEYPRWKGYIQTLNSISE